MKKGGDITVIRIFVTLILVFSLTQNVHAGTRGNLTYNYFSLDYLYPQHNVTIPFCTLAAARPEESKPQAAGEITCPEDISTYTDINSCNAYISDHLNVVFTENEVVRLTWEMTGATEDASKSTGINQINEHLFDEGTTHVTYTITDKFNQVTTCTFTVTISDNQVPRLENMPGNITVSTDPGECLANVSWNEPTASDNCTPLYQIFRESSARPGSSFPVGKSTVTYRAYDAMGNQSAPRSFTITVEDTEPPELILPADLTLNCGDNIPAPWQTYPQLTASGGFATDNCTLNPASFRLLDETTSNNACPYTITRTYLISDVTGNTTTAQYRIAVKGEGPTPTPEPQETVTLKSGMGTMAESLTFTTNGTFTPPAGVTSITVEAWGGGGGGAGSTTNKYSGGGGGGGAYTINNSVAVIPGTPYSITVGGGGSGGTGDVNGTNGGNSAFNGATVVANGGNGGRAPITSTGGTGGTGGTYSGGNGGNGGTTGGSSGGGGGSSAGTASNGNNGGTPTAGAAVLGGGAGGAGGTAGNSGSPGSAPGGGGGGAGDPANGPDLSGGAGARGQMIISWDCPVYSVTGISIPEPFCAGTSQTITLNSTAAGLPVGSYQITYSIIGANTVNNQTVSMVVTTAGTGSFTSVVLPNSGNNTFTINYISSGISPQICGNSSTANQPFTVYGTPVITTQPVAPEPTCPGAGAQSMTVAVSGGYNLTYNWRKGSVSLANGGTVSGQGTATLTLTNPTAADAGSYDVVIGSACAPNVTSNAATVSLKQQTAITAQSTAAQTQCINGTFNPITVTAAGSGTLTYQWYSNTVASTSDGTAISGAENASYTPPATTAGTTYYYVVVTGDCGTATSNISGAFVVNAATEITAQSTDTQIVCEGGAFNTLSVTATGSGTLTYQWYSNTAANTTGGTAISGATGSTYTPPATVPGTRYYYAIVTGSCGSATSAVSGAFTVNPSTKITTQSTAGQTICLGESFTEISVTATGSGTLNYQWYSNTTASATGGTDIPGATNSTFIPPSASVGTLYYYVVISGGCGTITSAISGAFTANPVTAITSQSTGTQTVCQGVAFSPISVTAAGSGTLAYQWYSNTVESNSGGSAISGATSSSYTPSSAVAGTLYYYATVTGGCGTATSAVSGAFHVTQLATVSAGPAIAAICQGSTTAPLEGSVGGSATGGTWSSSVGGTFSPSANDLNATWTPPAAYKGTATLTLTSAGPCATVSASKTIVVYEQPAIVVQPVDMTDCYERLVEFNVTATGTGLSYQWMRKRPTDTNFFNISGADLHVDVSIPGKLRIDNIGVSSYHPDQTQYKVVVTNGNCSIESNVVTLTVNRISAINNSISIPPVTNVVLCSGSAFSYTVETNHPGNVVSYQWKKWVTPGLWQNVTNNSIISGAQKATLSFTNATVNESGDYKVTVEFNATSSANCSVTSDLDRKLTFLPGVEPSVITGPQTICYNTQPAELSATSGIGGTGTGYSYQWQSSTDNINWSDIGSATALTYQPPVLTASTRYRMITTDTGTNSCGSATSASVLITVDAAPTATAGGTQTICVENTVTVSGATATNYSSILWTHNGSGTLTNETTLTPTYTPALTDAGNTVTLTLTVTGNNSCGATTATATYTIIVRQQPTATISYPDSPYCGTGKVSVTRTGQTGGTYSSTPGLVINITTGEIDLAYSTPGTYTVTYHFSDGNCNNSTTTDITILELPLAVTGPDGNICVGENVTLGATAIAGHTYSWTSDPAGFTSTDAQITVSPGVTTTYYLTETNTVTGCTNSNQATITSNQVISVTVTPATLTICSGQTTAITISTNYVGATISWTATVISGTLASGAVNGTGSSIAQTLVNTSGADAVVRYDINVVATPCENTTSFIEVTVHPETPVPTISSGSTTLCEGETVELTSTAATTYQWYKDGAPVAGATSQTYTATASGNYMVGTTNSFGCKALSAETAVTVNPRPTAQISGDNTICNGASATLNFVLTGSQPWEITYTDGTTPVTVLNITSSPYTVSVTPSASTTYTLTSVRDANCTGTVSGAAAVIVHPLPTAILSGTSATCSGAPATLSIDLTGTQPWSITYTDGTTPVTVTGITATPHTLAVTPTVNTTYTLTAVSDANCTGTASGTAAITVNGIPTATLSGTATICAGETTDLTIALTGTPPWNLEYSDGTNTFTVSGINSSPHTIPVTPVSTTTYTITSFLDANCTGTSTGSATVTVRPLPTASMDGNAVVCQDATTPVILFSGFNGTPPYTFTYKIDGGANQTVTTTGGTNAVVFVPTNVADTYVYELIRVRDGGTTFCFTDFAAGTVTATVVVNPAPTVTIATNETKVCQNDTEPVVTITASGGARPYTFVYRINNGAFQTITTPAGQDFVTVNVPTTVADTLVYEVTSVTDANTCLVSLSDVNVSVIVSPPPAGTAEVTAAIACVGGTAEVTITATVGTPIFSYTLDGVGTNLTGVFTGIAAGAYTWSIDDASSCAPFTGTLTVANPVPLSFSTPAVTDVTCAGGSDGQIVIAAIGGTNTFTYSIIPNVGSQSPSGTFTGLSAQNYTITATDGNGCTADTTVTVGTTADTIPPVMANCPADITVNTGPGRTTCNQVVNWTAPTATDNCTPAGSLTWTLPAAAPGNLFPVGDSTITYVVADAAGKKDTCSFTITVVDNTPPVKPTLTSILAQCDITLPAPQTTDNCSGTISGTTTTVFPITQKGETEVIWTFTDASGNSVTANQLVNISDNVAPVWDNPAFFTTTVNRSCEEDTSPASTGTPTATDNCSPVTITYTDVITPGGCAGRYTISRNWVAADTSGNTNPRTQTISVNDFTKPTLNCRDTTVANPDSIFSSYLLAGLSFSDNCGIDTVYLVDEYYTFDDSTKAGFCPRTVVRRYMVYDKCGNSSNTCTQTIYVAHLDSCELCQSGVPYYLANLDDHPDSLWISPQHIRDGICCGAKKEPGGGPPRCTSFNVYLDQDAAGLVFDIYSGAPPTGALWYQVDCGPPVPVGEVICLAGGNFYTVTFCKPGNNPNEYSIQSVPGAVTPDSLTTRADVECFGTLHVTGLEPSTINWSVKYPAGADYLLQYLDTTDIANPTFFPDSITPPLIIYEVCGTLLGAPECDGLLMTDCGEVIVNTLPPINIHLDVDLQAICEDSIPPITADVPFEDPNLTYLFRWYIGSEPIGTPVSTQRTFDPPGLGTYTVVVTEPYSGVACNTDQYTFNVVADTIGPLLLLPPDTLFLNCSDNFTSEILAWRASARAYENMDTTASIQVFDDYAPVDPGCNLVQKVHFWAFDICKNATLDSAYIVYLDDIAPIISPEASNQVVECTTIDPNDHPLYIDWLARHGGALATDDCDDDLTWTADTASVAWVGNGARDSITVTFTVTDDCGNSDQTTATFTVTDNLPPTIVCPPDVEDIIPADSCSIINLTILDPVITEDCSIPDTTWQMTGATVRSGTGSVIGQSFNVGITRVFYTVTDDAGLTDTCSFQVWLKHLDRPSATITCPQDTVRANADPVSCVAAVTLDAPVIVDPCNEIDSVWNNSPYRTSPSNASGNYPVGDTTVFNWYILDVSNNLDSCKVVVIVSDVDKPEFTFCPSDMEDIIPADSCSITNLTPGIPLYTEPCGATISYILTGATTGTGTGLISGVSFNVGQTLVTYILTDTGNNTDTCSFQVWVKHLDRPSATITCPTPDTIRVDADPVSCVAVVTLDAPVIVDPCNEIDSVWNNSPYRTSPSNASGNYPVGDTTVFNWYILDVSLNLDSCEVVVIVSDVDKPEFTFCPSDMEDIIPADSCSITNLTPGVPLYTEPCGATISYILTGATSGTGTGLISGVSFNVGQTLVTYILTDTGNNTDTCSFQVWVKHLDRPSATITCPTPDTTRVDADPVSCVAAVTLDAPVIVDPCNEIDSVWNNSPYRTSPSDASGNYAVGTTVFNWYILDVSLNLDSCEVVVIVNDVDKPHFTYCPPDLEDIIAADSCSVTNLTLDEPEWNEPCGATLSYILTGATSGTGTGLISGVSFNVGQTLVTYILTDTGNNTDTCRFTVWVKHIDVNTYTYDCPPPLVVVSADTDSCNAYVPLDKLVLLTDPCHEVDSIWNDSPYQTDRFDASGTYPIDTVDFHWYIADNSGRIFSCPVRVIVNDLMPTLICPPSDTVQADFNLPYNDTVSVGLPTFHDNCPDSILTWRIVEPDNTTTYSPATGINFVPNPSRYYLGVTTLTYYFTDMHGNVDSCSFTVTVLGAPEIDCPPDTIIYLQAGNNCEANFNPGVPDLIQGVPPITWTYTVTQPDGDVFTDTYIKNSPDQFADPLPASLQIFEPGVTTIAWRAENISGFDTCSHWVEVIDTIPPAFTLPLYENCVDPLHTATYDPANANPLVGQDDPNLLKNPSPDYRTFTSGDTALDLLTLSDNCCDSASMIIHWRIEFTDTPDPLIVGVDISHPDITGTGQPSEYVDPDTGLPADIKLWGDGVYFFPVEHHIIYQVEDCHGNVSKEFSEVITITPRPKIEKLN